MTIYRLFLLLHMLGAAGFIITHAFSAYAVMRLQAERSYDRICRLLSTSARALIPTRISLGLTLLSGIVMMVMAGWWRFGWVWAALALVIAIGMLMYQLGSRYMTQVRAAAETGPSERLFQVIRSGKASALALVGTGGLAAILALMVFKPF